MSNGVKICFLPLAALGFIIEPPQPAVAPLGTNATFRCAAVGNVFWSIQNLQVVRMVQASIFALNFIFVPLPTPSQSEVIITATPINNGTMVECIVEEQSGGAILNRSRIVTLQVIGESDSFFVHKMISSLCHSPTNHVGNQSPGKHYYCRHFPYVLTCTASITPRGQNIFLRITWPQLSSEVVFTDDGVDIIIPPWFL